MKFKIKEGFLKKLVDAPSPSGFEQPAQRVWRAEVSQFAGVKSDVLGNAIGIIEPVSCPRIMLSGHCDEIGLLVRLINNDGFIYVGGLIEPSLLPGKRLLIHTKRGDVLGVAGKKPAHLQKDAPPEKPKIENAWIDIGAKTKKEAEELIEIGDPITFADGYQKLRNNLVIGRGFDDKIGSFIVAETLRYLKTSEKPLTAAVYGVSSTQEETGLRGVRPAAFNIDPQIAIIIDVTHATDSPAVSAAEYCEIKLGRGPAISRGIVTNPVVYEKLIETAKTHNIPYQIEPCIMGAGTETYVVQLSRSGVATALVSVPNRYMHTPVEIVSLDDVKNIIVLLAEFILKIDKNISFIPQ